MSPCTGSICARLRPTRRSSPSSPWTSLQPPTTSIGRARASAPRRPSSRTDPFPASPNPPSPAATASAPAIKVRPLAGPLLLSPSGPRLSPPSFILRSSGSRPLAVPPRAGHQFQVQPPARALLPLRLRGRAAPRGRGRGLGQVAGDRRRAPAARARPRLVPLLVSRPVRRLALGSCLSSSRVR